MARRLAVLLAGVLAAGTATVAPGPALADHVDPPGRVTLMGSLMSELGCATDWDEGCEATDLLRGEDGTWSTTGALPPGAYELKVRMDGS